MKNKKFEFILGDLNVEMFRDVLKKRVNINDILLKNIVVNINEIDQIPEEDFIRSLNSVLTMRYLYKQIDLDLYKNFFNGRTKKLLKRVSSKDAVLEDQDLRYLNRFLLQTIYPYAIRRKIIGFFDKNSPAREWTESLIIAFVLAMVIRTFAIQAFKIPTGSMRMTLIEGDRILVNKLKLGPMIPFKDKRIKGYGALSRGDVVVFKYPENPKRDFIKRLIAFPGEIISIRNGDVYIDGKKVEDEEIKNIFYYNRGDYGAYNQIVKVPENYYYVLGDNSASSMDSRFWGFVPENYLIGKAEVIYWPPNRIRAIK